MLEDRGVPRPDWARRFFEAHGQEHEVIGGAIENGRDRALSWALYFCDFGRFQLPFEAGPADWVSDINVCYKPSALERTRSLWEQRYHETTVHWALQRMGVSLFLTPDVVVDQIREPAGLSALLVERFAWGRLFASTRARESGTFQRLTLGALTPLLPGLLLARQVRQRLRRGGGAARFLQALPAIVLLLVAWSAGEMVGYLTADG